jgi:nucleoside-diphosphate-sugar epimerase
MKTLVLGAGGFIGGHLVKDLIERGYYVRAIGRKSCETCATEFILGDLRDYEFVRKIMDVDGGFDEVYQLAADMGGATYINCGLHDADVMSNSVSINVNVAKAAVDFKVKKLFFASSACVYHTSTCREDEAYPAEPDNEYGWEKLFSERMYKNFQKQYGLQVKIARFHSTIGEYSQWKGGREKAHSALARKVAMVEDGGVIDIIGDGTQKRTFMYIQDCIDGIRLLMDSDTDEIINIGSDKLVTINEYLDILKKISNKNFTVRSIGEAVGTFERSCDLTRARQILNWEPKISLEDATRKTYEWILTVISST